MNQNISVFIIANDVCLHYYLELIFESFEISCSTVNSIETAKAELETYIPTFVLLDDTLPEDSLSEFVEYLNTNFPCVRILLTNEDNLVVNANISNKKIFQLIKKPFKLKEIKVIVGNLVKIPRCNKAEKCYFQDCSRLVS